MAKDHGPSVKDDKQYEAAGRKGGKAAANKS
jgi:hypothetical protein